MLLTVAALIVERPFTTTWVRKAGGAPEVRSGRRTPSSQLVTGAVSGAAPLGEAMRVAERVTITDHFSREFLPSGTQPTDLVTIATPTWGVFDEEDEEIIYEAFTVDNAAGSGEKSMYVKFPRADGWLRHDFTQAIVALIELAEGILDCDRLYVCVDRDMKGVNSLVHSLIYVGFSARGVPNKNNDKYLLLGYETE